MASSDNDMTTNPNFSPKARRCSAAASHAAVRAATHGFQASTPNKKNKRTQQPPVFGHTKLELETLDCQVELGLDRLEDGSITANSV